MDYYEAIGLIALAVLAFLYTVFKRKMMNDIIHWFSSFKKEKFEGEQINKEFVNIYERMVEIKTKLDADRVFIDQFHNGSTFVGNAPIWRITRTYECCASGVSYESMNVQGIIAISIWDSLSSIFDIKINSYCKKLEGDVCEKGCKNPYGVYSYSVDKMPETFSKVMLRNQGVVSYLQVPIISDGKNIIGIVGVHFLDDDEKEIDPCFLCQKVQEISYFLNKE